MLAELQAVCTHPVSPRQCATSTDLVADPARQLRSHGILHQTPWHADYTQQHQGPATPVSTIRKHSPTQGNEAVPDWCGQCSQEIVHTGFLDTGNATEALLGLVTSYSENSPLDAAQCPENTKRDFRGTAHALSHKFFGMPGCALRRGTSSSEMGSVGCSNAFTVHSHHADASAVT